MKKYMEILCKYIWISIVTILLTGCNRVEDIDGTTVATAEITTTTSQEDVNDNLTKETEKQESHDEDLRSRYLIGKKTVFEVKKDETVVKRYEMEGKGNIKDIIADENGTIYVLTFEYTDENTSMVLYEINSKQEIREIYRASYYKAYLIRLDGKVTIVAENNRTDEKWFVIYEKQTDSCIREEYKGEEISDSEMNIFQKKEKAFKNKYDGEYLTEDKECFYYIKEKEKRTAEEYYDLYQLNKETGEERIIMNIPILTSGYRGYQIIDDSIYFELFDGKVCKWMRHSLSGDGETIDLRAIDYSKDYAEYGRLRNIYYSVYDDLDEEYMSVYLEKFYFDETLPYGEKMNKVLENSYNTTIANLIEEIRVGELEDKNRDELYEIGEFSQTLQDVQAFDEHYVNVGFEYEWYRSYWFLHYTFDMDTGELLTLDNMYHGTEEHYKEVVAKYFVDTYKEEIKEGNEGFTEDMNYQYFYDRLSTNMYVIFGEDGLHVVFNAYDIVQYRDEEFAVIVPYEELDIQM